MSAWVHINSLVKHIALSTSLVVVGDGLFCSWGLSGALLQDQLHDDELHETDSQLLQTPMQDKQL